MGVFGEFPVARASCCGVYLRVLLHPQAGSPVPPTRRGETWHFILGDKVIYPNHGLGIVERIEEKTILGTTCGFFHLRIVSNDTTVLVPVANVDNVGLRRAIDDDEVNRLFSLLGDGKIDNHQNWKGRFKDNSDKMRTGSIYDMADVLKSLTFLSRSKSLSFREKRMLDRAKALIVSEVSEVMRAKAPEIEQRVDEALEKCFSTKVRTLARATAAKAKTAKPVKAAAPPIAARSPARRRARVVSIRSTQDQSEARMPQASGPFHVREKLPAWCARAWPPSGRRQPISRSSRI